MASGLLPYDIKLRGKSVDDLISNGFTVNFAGQGSKWNGTIVNSAGDRIARMDMETLRVFLEQIRVMAGEDNTPL